MSIDALQAYAPGLDLVGLPGRRRLRPREGGRAGNRQRSAETLAGSLPPPTSIHRSPTWRSTTSSHWHRRCRKNGRRLASTSSCAAWAVCRKQQSLHNRALDFLQRRVRRSPGACLCTEVLSARLSRADEPARRQPAHGVSARLQANDWMDGTRPARRPSGSWTPSSATSGIRTGGVTSLRCSSRRTILSATCAASPRSSGPMPSGRWANPARLALVLPGDGNQCRLLATDELHHLPRRYPAVAFLRSLRRSGGELRFDRRRDRPRTGTRLRRPGQPVGRHRRAA